MKIINVSLDQWEKTKHLGERWCSSRDWLNLFDAPIDLHQEHTPQGVVWHAAQRVYPKEDGHEASLCSLVGSSFSGIQKYKDNPWLGPAVAQGETPSLAVLALHEKIMECILHKQDIRIKTEENPCGNLSWTIRDPGVLRVSHEELIKIKIEHAESVFDEFDWDEGVKHWLSELDENYILVTLDRQIESPKRFVCALVLDGFLSSFIEGPHWDKVPTNLIKHHTAFGVGATAFEAFCHLSQKGYDKGLVSNWKTDSQAFQWRMLHHRQAWSEQECAKQLQWPAAWASKPLVIQEDESIARTPLLRRSRPSG